MTILKLILSIIIQTYHISLERNASKIEFNSKKKKKFKMSDGKGEKSKYNDLLPFGSISNSHFFRMIHNQSHLSYAPFGS